MEKIERNDAFWAENMVNELVQFYEDCVLPELLDPRRERNMEIRDPEYRIKRKKPKLIEKEKTNR